MLVNHPNNAPNLLKNSHQMRHISGNAEFGAEFLHNSLQPIMSLPAELLSSIFQLASSRSDNSDYPMILIDDEDEEDRYPL
ncbi:hypothetical protein DL93DRAFT_2080397 [Clavulina sp. PMI_390]|nr:hypothetical protein DL93DRAFT_2080397 [Clavulina sp. PMI_390]